MFYTFLVTFSVNTCFGCESQEFILCELAAMKFVFCWGCLHYDDIFFPFLRLLLGSIDIFKEKMKMLIYLFIYFEKKAAPNWLSHWL